MKTLDFMLQRAAISDDGGTVAGLAAAFDELNAYGERIKFGAFGPTLAAHEKRGTAPAMLLQHDHRMPVGRWTKLQETPEGLWVEGRVSAATEESRKARSLLTERLVDGLSIGFTASVAKRGDDGVKVIEKIELYEISFVAVPAAPSARVREVRSYSSLRDFETALRDDMGLSKAAARAVAARGWKGISSAQDSHDPAEIERQVSILFRSASNLERYLK